MQIQLYPEEKQSFSNEGTSHSSSSHLVSIGKKIQSIQGMVHELGFHTNTLDILSDHVPASRNMVL